MNTPNPRSRTWLMIGLLVLVAVIAVIPLVFGMGDHKDEPFAGADGQAEKTIGEVAPGYEAWYEPLIGELPGEVESGLFALQAAIGSGIVFYVIGTYRGRQLAAREAAAAATPPGAASRE